MTMVVDHDRSTVSGASHVGKMQASLAPVPTLAQQILPLTLSGMEALPCPSRIVLKCDAEAITLRQVLGAGTTQLEVAEALGGLPLTAVAGSSNAALVVIGQPQSGKGHTLFGSGASEPADAGAPLAPAAEHCTYRWTHCAP